MSERLNMAKKTRRRGVGKARAKQIANIINAAEIEFSQKGFDGASVQAIADRTDLSKRQVLYFFGTKKNLYQSVVSNIFKNWATFDLYKQTGHPRQILATYIERILRSSQEKPHLSKIVINEMNRGATMAIPVFREIKTEKTVRKLKERFESWQAEDKIGSIDPLQYIFLLWAAQHFYASFEPEIAYIMGRKKLRNKDWNNIIMQVKQIFLDLLEK
jgi:TetR/AcrR family transcriptional regulator